jgi:hypothetical protein
MLNIRDLRFLRRRICQLWSSGLLRRVFLILKMEVICNSETPVTAYKTKRHWNPGDSTRQMLNNFYSVFIMWRWLVTDLPQWNTDNRPRLWTIGTICLCASFVLCTPDRWDFRIAMSKLTFSFLCVVLLRIRQNTTDIKPLGFTVC